MLTLYPPRVTLMAKEMKRREVIAKLLANGCSVDSEDGDHTKWRCPCGKHTVNLPRHKDISPGVVKSSQKRMACLSEGWLQ